MTENSVPGQVQEDDGDILFDLDEHAICLYLSPAAKKLAGDQQDRPVDEVFAQFPQVLEAFRQVKDGKALVQFEIAGQQRWEIQAMYDDDGQFNGAIVSAQLLSRSTSASTSQPTQASQPTPATQSTTQPTIEPSVWSYKVDDDVLTLDARLLTALGRPAGAGSLAALAETRPALAQVFETEIRQLTAAGTELFWKEIQIDDASGNARWLSVRGQVCDRGEQGQIQRVVGSIADISDRLEEMRRKRQNESTMARVQRMEAIGELVGGIAHDFNNILSSIIGYTELALMEATGDAAMDARLSTYLQEVFQGGKRARELVAKMQTFSRVDKTQPQNLDLMLEVKEIVKMLRASLPSSIEIRIDIAEGLPEIFLDRTFLQQVIMNICINARDAMGDVGTIVIRGDKRLIKQQRCASCHGVFTGEYIELAIEDTGPGIPGAMVERVFEPYVTSKPSGSGMGLAMVHGIMHGQHGHVRVESIEGDGSEFRLFFKPAESLQAKAPLEPYLDVRKSPGNADKTILVVDDEVSLVYYLRELLHKKGYQVSVASDSHEAWDLFSANPEKFDLVITDQTMPGLSGVQLAAKMLTLRQDLPIILCTGYSDIVKEDNIRQYGIKGYMAKPIDSRELLRSVQNLLDAAVK
jgi:signal transduction histidine kinase/CheY-like chemotaxis protein